MESGKGSCDNIIHDYTEHNRKTFDNSHMQAQQHQYNNMFKGKPPVFTKNVEYNALLTSWRLDCYNLDLFLSSGWLASPFPFLWMMPLLPYPFWKKTLPFLILPPCFGLLQMKMKIFFFSVFSYFLLFLPEGLWFPPFQNANPLF